METGDEEVDVTGTGIDDKVGVTGTEVDDKVGVTGTGLDDKVGVTGTGVDDKVGVTGGGADGKDGVYITGGGKAGGVLEGDSSVNKGGDDGYKLLNLEMRKSYLFSNSINLCFKTLTSASNLLYFSSSTLCK